jgi:hypothetical protein
MCNLSFVVFFSYKKWLVHRDCASFNQPKSHCVKYKYKFEKNVMLLEDNCAEHSKAISLLQNIQFDHYSPNVTSMLPYVKNPYR